MKLIDFFSYMRPMGGVGERAFIDRYIAPVAQFVDGAGNLHVDLRGASNSRSLFVAHTDSVHREDGRQVVTYKDGQLVTVTGSCLGADDAAGVYVLLRMIEAKVPGYYIFTRGEECGGVGARWLAENMRDLLAQFDRAVAFDRRATHSVITHQGMSRCCSDKFAEALSEMLNDADREFMYCPDDTGVYTDTAEFTHIIPECTNLSVGYYKEHTPDEWLDVEHMRRVAKSAVVIDWESLPVGRDPSVVEPEYSGGRWGADQGYLDDAWDMVVDSWVTNDGSLEFVSFMDGVSVVYDNDFCDEAEIDTDELEELLATYGEGHEFVREVRRRVGWSVH